MFARLASKSAGPAAASPSAVYAVLDVGASKIACFILKVEQTLTGPRPRVVGVGHQSSRGIRAGAVIDMEAAAEAISAAVDKAEQMAGQAVSSVLLATYAGAPVSTRVSVEVALSAGEADDRDLRRAIAAGLQDAVAPGRWVLHAIPLSWRVDGHRGVKDPRGLSGRELGLDLHLVTAAGDPLSNLEACIARRHLDLSGVVASPYAAGLSVLTADETALGALLLDMGAQTTALAVFGEGALLHVDGAPVGGGHVTSDIARGLSTPPSAAERIKTLYGSALESPDDESAMIEVPPIGGDPGAAMGSAPRAMLNAIIRPRLEETFELLRDRLAASGAGEAAGRRLVLTGGAAQLPGAAELAGRVFSKQVRIGRPQGLAGLAEAVSGPGFAAAAGLALKRFRGAPEAIASPLRCPNPARAAAQVMQTPRRGPRAVLRWLAECF